MFIHEMFSSPEMADGENGVFRQLLDAAPDGILLSNKQGQILMANLQCAKMLEYTVAEMTKLGIEDLVPASARVKHASLRGQYFEKQQARPMGVGLELSAMAKSGKQIPVEISLSPFHYRGEYFVIAVLRDVTIQRQKDRELKRMNKELARSNKELEQFAYVASHDLQEPLRMVSGYTQLLKRRYHDKIDDDAKEFIDFAVEGVKRMQNLISDLLTYSRVSTKQQEFKNLSARSVVDQAIANLQVLIEEMNAEIVIKDLPFIYGDFGQLVQLWQNLLSNAIKFSPKGVPPLVEIWSHDNGASYRFFVKDSGIGMSEKYREKVFVIFQRLLSREDYAGTGIGLAICKKVVERHGGVIDFASEEGKGTVFHFDLPKQTAPEGVS